MKASPNGSKAWVAVYLILTALVFAPERVRAETKQAATSHPAYRKTIPGSTQKISGSRPRTYVKPKKLNYEQHMETFRQPRFKNEPFKNQSASFGYHATDKHTFSSRVLTSAPPSSRVNVQKRMGRPAPSISRNQPMSDSDFRFMGKLSDTLKATDPGASSRLDQIMAGQKQNRPLTKAEYDVLMGMSKTLDDGDVSYRLHSIAEKRRQEMY